MPPKFEAIAIADLWDCFSELTMISDQRRRVEDPNGR